MGCPRYGCLAIRLHEGSGSAGRVASDDVAHEPRVGLGPELLLSEQGPGAPVLHRQRGHLNQVVLQNRLPPMQGRVARDARAMM